MEASHLRLSFPWFTKLKHLNTFIRARLTGLRKSMISSGNMVYNAGHASPV
jgi:hypothetical protein